MKRIPVSSRAILSVGYDAGTRELEVEFRNHRVYRYREVPSDVHQFLMRTPDKGRYVNRILSERFSYEALTRDRPTREYEQDLATLLEASLRKRRERD
jgi:hypothetical protein